MEMPSVGPYASRLGTFGSNPCKRGGVSEEKKPRRHDSCSRIIDSATARGKKIWRGERWGNADLPNKFLRIQRRAQELKT